MLPILHLWGIKGKFYDLEYIFGTQENQFKKKKKKQ